MFFLLRISFRHELANVENQFHIKVDELKIPTENYKNNLLQKVKCEL